MTRKRVNLDTFKNDKREQQRVQYFNFQLYSSKMFVISILQIASSISNYMQRCSFKLE